MQATAQRSVQPLPDVAVKASCNQLDPAVIKHWLRSGAAGNGANPEVTKALLNRPFSI